MKKFLAALFLFGFLLNFVWEVTQIPLYSTMKMGTIKLIPFIGIHWGVSVGDALMILVAYLITGLVFRNALWRTKKTIGPWVLFLLGLVAWQAGIEYLSVYIWHRWAYSTLMPTVFGIGLAPILQMLILPPIAIFLSRAYIEK